MSWYIAPSLLKLTEEVNARMAPPTWPTTSVGDGAVGDTSHQARPSDHNPDYNDGGVVRAVDIGIQGRDARAILNEVIGDPRVWYVIHRSRIYSRTYGWAANHYSGSNPHNHHIHISIRHGREFENDRRDWFGKAKPKRTKGGLPFVDLSNVRARFEDGKRNVGVRRIQRALNARYGLDLKVDGYAGNQTREGWRLHERKMGLKQPNAVPHMHSLRALGRGRFAVRK
jgi:hypothetical protein